jgi:hypothetical protein
VRLHLGLIGRQADDEFLVVLETFRNGGIALFDALVFHEAGGLSHDL